MINWNYKLVQSPSDIRFDLNAALLYTKQMTSLQMNKKIHTNVLNE